MIALLPSRISPAGNIIYLTAATIFTIFPFYTANLLYIIAQWTCFNKKKSSFPLYSGKELWKLFCISL